MRTNRQGTWRLDTDCGTRIIEGEIHGGLTEAFGIRVHARLRRAMHGHDVERIEAPYLGHAADATRYSDFRSNCVSLSVVVSRASTSCFLGSSLDAPYCAVRLDEHSTIRSAHTAAPP